MRPSLPLASIAITLTLAAAGCGGSTAEPAGTGSRPSEVGLLFVHAAPHGTMVSPAGDGRYTLTLRDSAPQVIWFSDRPERHFGHLAVERFVTGWGSFGFAKDPPNGALTLLRADDSEDTVILELGQPSYDANERTLSFPARVLEHANGRLADFESANDKGVPERFAEASLFIDDTSGYGPLQRCCQYGAEND
jgi:hypothetical protein